MTITQCARCQRAADPDTELLVVVLGVPMCAACSEQVEQEQDAEMAQQERRKS